MARFELRCEYIPMLPETILKNTEKTADDFIIEINNIISIPIKKLKLAITEHTKTQNRFMFYTDDIKDKLDALTDNFFSVILPESGVYASINCGSHKFSICLNSEDAILAELYDMTNSESEYVEMQILDYAKKSAD